MASIFNKDCQIIKIAYVYNYSFFLGGGEISFYELICSIERDRFEPIIIVSKAGELDKKHLEKKETVYVSPSPSPKTIICGSPLPALFNLIKIFKYNKIGIIHVNGSRACFYTGIAGRILGIPVVWHVRETKKDLLLYDGLLSLLSSVIICVSKSVRSKRFKRFGGTINKKISVVYNGVDTNKFKNNNYRRQAIRKELAVENKEVLFGIIGNIIPLKGQDFFLRAFSKVKREQPEISLKLLMVGRQLDSAFHRMILGMVSEMDLHDNVILLEHTEKIKDIYSALDVFVLPSRREGFSRSLLEAMSFGLPVLGSKIDAIAEAFVDPESRILVDYGDIESMASGMVRLAKNKTLRKGMGEKNRKRVCQKFDLKRHAESIQRIYSELL